MAQSPIAPKSTTMSGHVTKDLYLAVTSVAGHTHAQRSVHTYICLYMINSKFHIISLRVLVRAGKQYAFYFFLFVWLQKWPNRPIKSVCTISVHMFYEKLFGTALSLSFATSRKADLLVILLIALRQRQAHSTSNFPSKNCWSFLSVGIA